MGSQVKIIQTRSSHVLSHIPTEHHVTVPPVTAPWKTAPRLRYPKSQLRLFIISMFFTAMPRMKQDYVILICPFYRKPSRGKAQTDRLLETLTVEFLNRIMCLHLPMVGQGRWQERFKKNWIQLQLHIMNRFLPSHLYSRAIVLSPPQAAPPSYMKLCIVFFLSVFS